MVREIAKTKSEKSIITTFAVTDEMDGRLRVTLFYGRLSKGQFLREAVHQHLLRVAEQNSEVAKYIREELGHYGDPLAHPKFVDKPAWGPPPEDNGINDLLG